MKDKLVSTEVANLARQKGFTNVQTFLKEVVKHYVDSGGNKTNNTYTKVEYVTGEVVPTQSLLQKWLRDVHNIDVHAQPYVMTNSEGDYYIADESYGYFVFKDGTFMTDGTDCLDFESALEEGLREGLQLLQWEKENL